MELSTSYSHKQVNFDEAIAFISDQRSKSSSCVIAIDQPTIVPNQTSTRPVDRVAASLMSFVGGGVQPANRSKMGMFDDEAPKWAFKKQLDAIEEPEESRIRATGVFLIEVFPALTLTALYPESCARLRCLKYNPVNIRFCIEHWKIVIDTIARYADMAKLTKIKNWTLRLERNSRPTKADKDKLDSVLCVLIGYHWRLGPRADSILIGDTASGYMITPAHAAMRERLERAATKRGVAIT